MNREQMNGNWKLYAGKMREKWGRLTHNDAQRIAGRRDQLIGRLQHSYGAAKEKAAKQMREFGRWLDRSTRR